MWVRNSRNDRIEPDFADPQEKTPAKVLAEWGVGVALRTGIGATAGRAAAAGRSCRIISRSHSHLLPRAPCLRVDA